MKHSPTLLEVYEYHTAIIFIDLYNLYLNLKGTAVVNKWHRHLKITERYKMDLNPRQFPHAYPTIYLVSKL